MKLIELLNVMDKNDFVNLGIEVCGMQFETRHTVEYFIGNDNDLNERNVLGAYLSDGDFHVRIDK